MNFGRTNRFDEPRQRTAWFGFLASSNHLKSIYQKLFLNDPRFLSLVIICAGAVSSHLCFLLLLITWVIKTTTDKNSIQFENSGLIKITVYPLFVSLFSVKRWTVLLFGESFQFLGLISCKLRTKTPCIKYGA